jgi:hypothetical protein
MTSRRSFVQGALLLATALAVSRAEAQPRKPSITVYRDPT